MKFKNSVDLKYYLYISDAKLEMLYQQVASSGKDKKSLEWGFDIKAFKATSKAEAEGEPDKQDKLKAVISALEYSELVGTIEESKEYVKGVLPMRWGLFRDAGRPSEEPPLVYFGGRTATTVFGLGGSSRHVVGNSGASATGSRSATPFLVSHLLDGLGFSSDEWVAYGRRGEDHDYQTYVAIALATDHLKGPDQNLDFFAKTLLQEEFLDPYTARTTSTRVLLGTPLYVALASPYPADVSNY